MSDANVIDAPENLSDAQVPGIQPVAADISTESAPVTPTDGDNPPADTPPEPEGKVPASIQKSINRLTRRAGEAERRAMRAEARADALEALRAQTPTPAQPKGAELKQSDFGTYDEFIRAQARQEAREAVKQEMTVAQQEFTARQSDAAQRERGQTFLKEATAQAKAAGIDFEDAWETLIALPKEDVSEAVAAYIFEAENKAGLVDYFAKNTDEIARISSLTPAAANRELAKVEVRLSTKPAPKRSSAPPPPPTLGGGGVAPTGIERMPHADLRKLVAGWARK